LTHPGQSIKVEGMVIIGLLTIHFQLPGVSSLKEKRSLVKPILSRLHKEFNISTAEVGHLDSWQESIIACTQASNDKAHTQRVLQTIVEYFEKNWPDLLVIEHHIEII
jgi:uncharacterized protein YlxP (DUF503 family)